MPSISFGILGLTRVGASTIWLKILSKTTAVVLPVKAGCPVSIS